MMVVNFAIESEAFGKHTSYTHFKINIRDSRHWWLIILVTWESEIGRVMVTGQHRQKIL
jgi:hypothetical protein